MATLSSALNYALSGLSVTAVQSALVSRNVSFASDENYTRKTAEIYTLPGGAPAVSSYGRSMDKQLLEKFLGSTSSAAGKQVMLDALGRMSATIGDSEADGSLASMMGKLQESLRIYETNPANVGLASAVVETARTLTVKLNDTSAEIVSIRADADREMAGSVDRINTLLAQFKIANDSVVRGTGSAGDLAENLDQRERILKLLSEEIGIRTTTRPNNDILIYAEGGAVLFEGSPRTVTMQATSIFDPTTFAQPVFIDGVAVTGPAAPMPASGGKLSSLAAVRDDVTFAFQRQVDEIASGLIRSFAEQDQSVVPLLPDVAGLFLDTSGGLPAAGIVSPGLASRIAINPLADPAQGGDPLIIRDGGMGGAAYVSNQQGSSSYQGRIGQLIEAFDATLVFDAASGLGTPSSLKSFSVQSAGWVEAQRHTARSEMDSAGAARVRANESLLRVTGVNIDQEMAALLDLEKSYQASSKVISVIDAMLATLLEAVR
jgi:flagellar hook-associated protein 1 FlgK